METKIDFSEEELKNKSLEQELEACKKTNYELLVTNNMLGVQLNNLNNDVEYYDNKLLEVSNEISTTIWNQKKAKIVLETEKTYMMEKYENKFSELEEMTNDGSIIEADTKESLADATEEMKEILPSPQKLLLSKQKEEKLNEISANNKLVENLWCELQQVQKEYEYLINQEN